MITCIRRSIFYNRVAHLYIIVDPTAATLDSQKRILQTEGQLNVAPVVAKIHLNLYILGMKWYFCSLLKCVFLSRAVV